MKLKVIVTYEFRDEDINELCESENIEKTEEDLDFYFRTRSAFDIADIAPAYGDSMEIEVDDEKK